MFSVNEINPRWSHLMRFLEFIKKREANPSHSNFRINIYFLNYDIIYLKNINSFPLDMCWGIKYSVFKK